MPPIWALPLTLGTSAVPQLGMEIFLKPLIFSFLRHGFSCPTVVSQLFCFFFLLHIWREKVGFKNIQFIRTTEQVSTSISRINVDQRVLSYTTVSRSVFDWVFGVILSNNISLSSLGNHCFFHNTLRGLKSTTEPLADDPFKWNLDAKTFDLWCFAVGFEQAGVFGVHVSIFFVCKTS